MNLMERMEKKSSSENKEKTEEVVTKIPERENNSELGNLFENSSEEVYFLIEDMNSKLQKTQEMTMQK